MAKMSHVLVSALALGLLAASAFAAAPAMQIQPVGANTPLVTKTVVDEIFAPAPGVQPASSVAFVIRGVCSVTCQPCFGTCPRDPDTGLHQSCVSACP